MNVSARGDASASGDRKAAISPIRTLVFPVAFIAMQAVSTLVAATAGDGSLAIDGILLTIPMALLVWPAHAYAFARLNGSRFDITDRQQFFASALSGGLAVFALYPFRVIAPERVWDYARLAFPLMYWGVAVSLTWGSMWLFSRKNSRRIG